MSREKDNKLIDQILVGNQKQKKLAVQQIYDQGFDHVRNLVYKFKGDLSLAEDIFQEGMMILFQNLKLGKFKGDASLQTYLFNICKYQLYQHTRKQKDQVGISNKVQELYQEPVPIKQSIKPVDIMELIAKVGADCKKVLTAFYYEKKSMKEIMIMFGLSSEQAAKNKKSRCMKALMKRIKERKLTLAHFQNP